MEGRICLVLYESTQKHTELRKIDPCPYEIPPEFLERICNRTGLSRADLFAPEFQELKYKEQAERIVADLSIYFHPETSDKVRDYCTTVYLRAYCGCEEETYYDELTQNWVALEGHNRGCLRERFQIQEDLSNKTLHRRKGQEKPYSPEKMQTAEENLYA